MYLIIYSFWFMYIHSKWHELFHYAKDPNYTCDLLTGEYSLEQSENTNNDDGDHQKRNNCTAYVHTHHKVD